MVGSSRWSARRRKAVVTCGDPIKAAPKDRQRQRVVIMWRREQNLPSLGAAPELDVSAFAARLGARGTSGAVRPGCGRAARLVAAVRLLRARGAGLPAASPADDGGGAAVRVLRRCAVVAQDREALLRGRG